MKDYKLKVILIILSAIVFSLLFIIMAFVLPVEKESADIEKIKRPKSVLEKISQGIGK